MTINGEPCPCPEQAGAAPTILVVQINVDECWAIDLHWSGAARTPLGDLLNRAKTYRGGKPGEEDAAAELGHCLAWWARHLSHNVPVSQIDRADVVCAVPANPPKMPFNLPDRLASAVALALEIPCDVGLLRKSRPTDEVKFTTEKERKLTEISGAYEVTTVVQDRTVVVVDDVVLSGATLETIASVLRAAGARRVVALVATRATKGLAASRS